jgi:hypothetical protein
MDIGAIYKQAKKAVADNAPAILTAIGVTGTITTAVLASKASFKAAEVLREMRETEFTSPASGEKLEVDFKTAVINTWQLYVPAVGTGIITVACMIAANHIGTRRAAALASAYTVSRDLFKEYKDKVIEKLGEDKEQEVRDEIAQDRLSKESPSSAEIFVVGEGEVLCYDMHSGRYFKSSLEGIKKAENDTNYQILRDNYASLTEFWDRVGLPQTSESDEIGWTTDSKLEIEYSGIIGENGKPCIAISFTTIPVRGYYSCY